MRIALDAMGGDKAPSEIIKGALMAYREKVSDIIIVGNSDKIKPFMEDVSFNETDFTLVHTDEYIEMNESPAKAIKKKKNSSIAIARLIKENKADALVSAGNTGALMQTALLTLGRIPGIKRPALATFWPTKSGNSMLLDSGANSETKPEYLLQFAVMADIFMKDMYSLKSPKIGLLNIGTEPYKGTSVVVTAYQMLKESGLNFIGNVEMRDFLHGKADVAVCDGFVGNMVLKSGEAVAEYFHLILKEEIMKNTLYKLAAGLIKPVFRGLKKKLDHSEHGGANLLGVKGICIKSHGSADAKAIYNAIKVADKMAKSRIIKRICDLMISQGNKESIESEEEILSHI